jgi:uncharacterized protein
LADFRNAPSACGSPFGPFVAIARRLSAGSSGKNDLAGALNTVTGYGAGYVEINLQRHVGSILVMPEAPVIPWPVASFEALTPEHFAMLVEPAPEVVIFGSGERLRFPHPRLTAALAAHRIGVETMDFKAACRTYNILMAEGRKVAAALLIEG